MKECTDLKRIETTSKISCKIETCLGDEHKILVNGSEPDRLSVTDATNIKYFSFSGGMLLYDSNDQQTIDNMDDNKYLLTTNEISKDFANIEGFRFIGTQAGRITIKVILNLFE